MIILWHILTLHMYNKTIPSIFKGHWHVPGRVSKFPDCVCKHIKTTGRQKLMKFQTRIQQCFTNVMERSSDFNAAKKF